MDIALMLICLLSDPIRSFWVVWEGGETDRGKFFFFFFKCMCVNQLNCLEIIKLQHQMWVGLWEFWCGLILPQGKNECCICLGNSLLDVLFTNNRYLRSCSPCKEIAKATTSLHIINPSSRLQLKMHLCRRLCWSAAAACLCHLLYQKCDHL